MKFNLKNRPKAVVGVLGHLYDGDEIVEWFEGFEAELRERRDEIFPETYQRSKEFYKNHLLSLFKEILGE